MLSNEDCLAVMGPIQDIVIAVTKREMPYVAGTRTFGVKRRDICSKESRPSSERQPFVIVRDSTAGHAKVGPVCQPARFLSALASAWVKPHYPVVTNIVIVTMRTRYVSGCGYAGLGLR